MIPPSNIIGPTFQAPGVIFVRISNVISKHPTQGMKQHQTKNRQVWCCNEHSGCLIRRITSVFPYCKSSSLASPLSPRRCDPIVKQKDFEVHKFLSQEPRVSLFYYSHREHLNLPPQSWKEGSKGDLFGFGINTTSWASSAMWITFNLPKKACISSGCASR